MNLPFKLIPTEKTYIAAVRHGLWKPEPGAPWGRGVPAERGEAPVAPSPKLQDKIISLLRKHQPILRQEIADKAKVSQSTVQKAMLYLAYERLVIASDVRITDKWGRSRKALSYTLPEAAP